MVRTSGLPPSANTTFERHLAEVRAGGYSDLLAGSMKNGPVKKPPRGTTSAMEAWRLTLVAAAAAGGLVAWWPGGRLGAWRPGGRGGGGGGGGADLPPSINSEFS